MARRVNLRQLQLFLVFSAWVFVYGQTNTEEEMCITLCLNLTRSVKTNGDFIYLTPNNTENVTICNGTAGTNPLPNASPGSEVNLGVCDSTLTYPEGVDLQIMNKSVNVTITWKTCMHACVVCSITPDCIRSPSNCSLESCTRRESGIFTTTELHSFIQDLGRRHDQYMGVLNRTVVGVLLLSGENMVTCEVRLVW